MPALLCAGSGRRHAGTTDVDVQVNLEIASGSADAGRLETALRNAEFVPGGEHVWRWKLADSPTVVKFELLADLDTEPNEAVITFDNCDELGAVNLRGTGYAAMDVVSHRIRAYDHGTWREAEINVTGLAGFLLAKMAAAHGRHKPKDWYDIAFVLLHNDYGDGDPVAAAVRVREVFPDAIGAIRTLVIDLQSNFADADAQGTIAYIDQITLDHPELDPTTAGADAQLAVQAFTAEILA
ncbi:nucleotidyl transferase AbiEii/AbiGii toxin family protein [Mycobacterium sp. 134]|uniref:nucleotidyl transferase AbiEii/AbiGii toxin family protein n=1 Tax=Mycobacterium sp. 134 TaxID=3400425 RepID=UPI003AB0D02C